MQTAMEPAFPSILGVISAIYWGLKKKTSFLHGHLGSKGTLYTPWKVNMNPTNHLFRKDNYLNQTSMIMFHVNLQERMFADDGRICSVNHYVPFLLH